jgi:hypothetical protein
MKRSDPYSRAVWVCFIEQFVNTPFLPDANDPVACKGKEIGDQMMWLEQMEPGYLGNLPHYFK